jgi:hypothetical protein
MTFWRTMPENGQSEKKKRLILFQNVLKLLGHWFKLESQSLKGQWAHPDVTETLSTIYYIYDVVPANKAATNIVLICSKHCIDCLHIKLSVDSSQGNPTYTATTLSKEEVIDNHMSVLSRFGLSMKDGDYDIHLLYRILKLHKYLYKQRNIAGAPKYSTKPSV